MRRGGGFDKTGNDDCRTKWEDLVKKCNSGNEDIDSSNFKHQFSCHDNFEDKSKDMRDKLIVYDQIRSWSLYVKHKPAKLAAYCKFLVSICFLCIHCNIAVTIVSHHYSVGVVQS